MIPVPFEEHYQVPASAIDTGTIATRAYVDSTLQNLDWKNSVKAISAAALAAYTRVGNVITANANGALAAVNVDHVQAPHSPAEEGHVQQLALEHIGQRV